MGGFACIIDPVRYLREALLGRIGQDLHRRGPGSGEVDSNPIKKASRCLSNFVVLVSDADYDEDNGRRAVVGAFDPDPLKYPVDGKRFADAPPEAVASTEGPMPHGGCVVLHARSATQSANPARLSLTGENADEMFDGYPPR